MESIKNSLIEDEIFYYSAFSNFGVGCKNIKPPKNIHISFSPLSSNQTISFCNTIMIPYITTEASMDTEKNISQYNNQTRKDYTRIKTESSRDEKNISCEKQATKILIETEIEKIDENTDEIEITKKDHNEQEESLEINPYFFGNKIPFDVTKFNNNNNSNEKKKVKKILNKNKKEHFNDEMNIFLMTTTKDLRKKASLDNKLNQKIKRLKSLNLNKVRSDINKEKEENNLKLRKKKDKIRTNPNKENNSNKNSDKNIFIKENKVITRRKREKTVINRAQNFQIKDNNIKAYKASLFNKNSSSNMNTKVDSNIIKDTKDENERNNKEKKKKIKYKGVSHKLFNIGLDIEIKEENKKLKKKNEEKKEKGEKKEKKEKKGSLRKKEILNKEQELNRNSTLRSNKKKISLSLLKSKIKKIKTLTKESTITSEKKKSQNAYRKEMSDAIKSLDFERALKNKNNLAKTQYNLFSPDKFTNTEFCDSDYLEYTLDCMDLILKQNNFQKQQKNKVNFNFPKTRGNKLKKIALFDLDETLVHCTGDIKLNNDPYQHCINIVLPGNKETKVGINIRPFWKKTLNLIKRYYHIVVFTASHQAYADAVLDFMDPSNKFFKYRLYRNNCSLVDIEGSKFYVKDLDIFDEFYDLKDIIIIDNSVLSFIYHLENGIPIVPYYNEDKDGSLYVVGLYLIHIYKEDDLREANKKYINLDSFLNEARTRNDNIIKEEPFYNNCNERNNIEKKMDKSNGKGSNIKKQSNSDKEIKIGFGNRTNPRRCSFSIDSPQHKLMCQSKLINMYYNINYNKPLTDQTDEIIEEKSNKSFSVEVEEKEEQNNNESHKNISELFFQRRLLTTVDKPKIVKRSSKSNKDLYNYFNLKMIRSDFYNKFSEGTFPI